MKRKKIVNDWDDAKLENPAIALKEWYDKVMEHGFKGINIVVGGRGAGRSCFMNKEILEYAQEQLKDLRRSELMSREHQEEKIKVVSAVIVRESFDGKPYYNIRYREPGSMEYHIGYGSYSKDFVEKWLEEKFEIVEEGQQKSLDDMLMFKSDFCFERCPDMDSCNHRYIADECEPLYKAMKENGFIDDTSSKDNIAKLMDGKSLRDMRPVELYNICVSAGMKVALGMDRKYYIRKMLDEGYDPEGIGEENVVQFPVNMDEMQRNILIGLLNARKEATEKGVLSSAGFVAVIDALFYLVRGVDGK